MNQVHQPSPGEIQANVAAYMVNKLNLIGNTLYESRVRESDKAEFEAAVDVIRGYLTGGFSTMKLLLYGSALNGFGSRQNCDLDMSIISGEFQIPNYKKHSLIHNLEDLLRNKSEISGLRSVTDTRVPIVKFNLSVGGKTYECNISIDNQLAIENTALMATYAELDERAAKLVMMAKSFIKVTI